MRAQDHSDTHVRIAGPLPLDVAGTLLTAIGTVYPTTRLAAAADGDAMHLLIADTDRPRLPELANVEPAVITGIDPAGIRFSTGPEIGAILAQALDNVIEEHDAENYVEFSYESPRSRYTMVVARSGRQTPHALRVAAEERAEAAESRARALEEELEELRRSSGA